MAISFAIAFAPCLATFFAKRFSRLIVLASLPSLFSSILSEILWYNSSLIFFLSSLRAFALLYKGLSVPASSNALAICSRSKLFRTSGAYASSNLRFCFVSSPFGASVTGASATSSAMSVASSVGAFCASCSLNLAFSSFNLAISSALLFSVCETVCVGLLSAAFDCSNLFCNAVCFACCCSSVNGAASVLVSTAVPLLSGSFGLF